MGIAIPQGVQSLEELSQKAPTFQLNKRRQVHASLLVWKVTEKEAVYVEWPYSFYSDENYIFMLVEEQWDKSHINKEKIPIEFAEIFFSAQFLKKYTKIQKKLRISQANFSMKVYSQFGDNQENQFQARMRLMCLMSKLERCLRICANCLTLRFLNEGQKIQVSSKLNQFIDFEGQHYFEVKNNQFITEALFGERPLLKSLAREEKQQIKRQNFPLLKIQPKKKKEQMINIENQLDNSSPFACEITQIKIKNKGKVDVDESNMLLKELQIQEQQPMIQEIAGKLFIGSEKCSRNYSLLNSHNIKMVINCAADVCKNWFLNDLDYQWIFFPDPYLNNCKEDINIECLVYSVTDVIQRYLKNSEKTSVLIHCAGIETDNIETGTRSVSLLIGIMMSYYGMTYDEALKTINKKWKYTKVHPIIEEQLRSLGQRLKSKNQFQDLRLYGLCSYSQFSPEHIVSKYLCKIQNVNNIQGINAYAQGVFIAVGMNSNKIMTGRQCASKEAYTAQAKKYIKLLSKYEGVADKFSIQNIDKTFRKQQPLEITQKLNRIDVSKKSKNPGFKANQSIILKYPLLRPVWQKKHDDGFYFTIKEKDDGADVILSKGINWIGYEEDKEQFFEKIINCYLKHLSHDKIFIDEDDADGSLFDTSEYEF